MTDREAKEILKLYRPGTADAEDPAFAEALGVCERDGQLKVWFAEHCALYFAFRTKFRNIRVPEGFKEQILAERPANTPGTFWRKTPGWQKAVLLAGAVAALAMIVSNLKNLIPHHEPHDFASYCSYVVSSADRAYGMNQSTNLDQIRSHFASGANIADYQVPANLEKNAKIAGFAATDWQGKKVSMLCFNSGRPLTHGRVSDVWLFITESTVAKDAPASAIPKLEKLNGLPGIVAAAWTSGNRTYILATPGDEEYLKQFLPL